MGRRIRALILVLVLVALGVFVGSALSQWWEVPGTAPVVEAVRAVAVPPERVRVEVLNASGQPNLARGATDVLREVGFDVVYYGNASTFDRDTSVVLDRVGDLTGARAVADALGVREVRSEPDSNLFVDVSVLLGAGWTAPVAEPTAATPPARAWWDPRGWIPSDEPGTPSPPAPTGALANPNGSGERP